MRNYHGYPSWSSKREHLRYNLVHMADDRVENGHTLEIRSEPTAEPYVRVEIPFKRVSPGHAIPNTSETNSKQVWTMQAGSVIYANQSSAPSSPTEIFQPLSSTTFDPFVLAQIKLWVDECNRKHETCHMSRTANQLTINQRNTKVRFIDVGPDESGTIHLVEEIEESGAKYITLSHRWTTATSMTTLRSSNKAAYYAAIPTDNWPKIYKDAVFVSRALGIRYLWIDSLCIIQDDSQDWSVQASLMHHVYAHGYLNLTGVGGEFFDGLEVTRNPASVSPCIVSRTIPSGLQEYWACYTGVSPAAKLANAPLFSRGWCYQERFLSTRTVHFSQQVYWECKTRQASETFGWSTENEHPDEITTWVQGSCTEPRDIWERIVSRYSRTELTNYSDRLVALRGIFNRFWERFDRSKEADWCVAGLWRKCMIQQLLWEYNCGLINDKGWIFHKDQDTEYYTEMEKELAIFPSWSWASCSTLPGYSDIHFRSLETYDYVEDLVEIISITPLNRHAFDQGYPAYESATMSLSGFLTGPTFDADKLLQDWNSWCHHSVVQAWSPNRTPGDGIKVNILLDRPLLKYIKPTDLQLLPVHFKCNQPWSWVVVEGLLVEALGTRDNTPTYRRVGKWEFRYGSDTNSSPIPGLPEHFYSKKDLSDQMREFRKRRRTNPRQEYTLV